MSGDDPEADATPPWIQPSLKGRKGRGAVSNLQGRHEVLAREAIDDMWEYMVVVPSACLTATWLPAQFPELPA